jgi:hypothetical protein
LNKPESSSWMTTSSAASAFGWQRRNESDDIKPLIPKGGPYKLWSRRGIAGGANADESGRMRLKEGAIFSAGGDDHY